MEMIEVLYVEDDEKIATEVVTKLEEWGYLPTRLKTVQQTIPIKMDAFQLIILDWNLPDGEGVEIARAVRDQKTNVPILMLTAKVEAADRKAALEIGVNDFLGKPFYFHELKARIDILLSVPAPQTPSNSKNVLECCGIKIIKDEMKVTYKNNSIPMKKKEYELLVFFMNNPNVVLSRAEIIDGVWNEGEYPTTRTVDTHILNLRKKFDPKMFKTVWSTGYRFVTKEDI